MPATKDLAEILSKRDPIKYRAIIERAALQGFHDHKFDSIPGHPEYAECMCPKMELVNQLAAYPELSDIRQQVMDGVYDEPADKEDQAEMRGWLIDDNSPDGMFTALGFEIPTKEERELWKQKSKMN
jgi:hypothetical protein